MKRFLVALTAVGALSLLAVAAPPQVGYVGGRTRALLAAPISSHAWSSTMTARSPTCAVMVPERCECC